MITTILFDVDGVLLDSLDANIEFYQELFKAAGHQQPTAAFLTDRHHLSVWDTITEVTGISDENEKREIMNLVDSLEYVPRYTSVLQPDVQETVIAIGQKYTIGVVTSRLSVHVYSGALFPLKDHFKTTVSFDDVTHPKPHPEPLLLAAERLNVDVAECVYIGDMPTDILAANAAGMQSIHFSPNKHEYATRQTTVFEELPDIIETLSSL